LMTGFLETCLARTGRDLLEVGVIDSSPVTRDEAHTHAETGALGAVIADAAARESPSECGL
jgi:hypothetical protein